MVRYELYQPIYWLLHALINFKWIKAMKYIALKWMNAIINFKWSLVSHQERVIVARVRTLHCSYLNIYISRKIRFCLGDMQGKVRVNFLTKSIIFFLSVNSNLLYLFMLYFLQELSNPVLFAHCWCYSQELKYLNCNLTQKCDSNDSTFWK